MRRRYPTIAAALLALLVASGWAYDHFVASGAPGVSIYLSGSSPTQIGPSAVVGKQHFDLQHPLQIEPGAVLKMSPNEHFNYALRPVRSGQDLLLYIDLPDGSSRSVNLSQVHFFPLPVTVRSEGNQWVVLIEGEREGKVLVRNYVLPK